MPVVKISLRQGKTSGYIQNLSLSVHQALMESLSIPDSDFHHRIFEFDELHWQLPPGKGAGYTLLEIDLFPGRSAELKKTMYKAILDRLETVGVRREDVMIIVNEPSLDNWCLRGGLTAREMQYRRD